MTEYDITKSFTWQGTITGKVASVCRMFGLTADRLRKKQNNFKCRLQINDGDIVYITGPSGAGKSVLLGELEKAVRPADRINLARIRLPKDKTLIDCFNDDFLTCLKTLSTAGLNDVFCILNQPTNLSEGQKYRFRLAMALAKKRRFIFADEFCSNLDRIMLLICFG